MEGRSLRKFPQRRGGRDAFTLVELMIVVVIVAVLALVAIPLMQSNAVGAIMSEGVAGTGTIRTALRLYASQNNGSYAGATLSTLQLASPDLEGRYFAQTDYALQNISVSTYLIVAGPPSKTTRTALYYAIDQNGAEQGTYLSHQ